jgi:hypothetical protein
MRDPEAMLQCGQKWNRLNFKRLGKVRVIIFKNIFTIIVPVDLSSYIFWEVVNPRDVFFSCAKQKLKNGGKRLQELLYQATIGEQLHN